MGKPAIIRRPVHADLAGEASASELERIVSEVLYAHYDVTRIEGFGEVGGTMTFRVPAALADPQRAGFRSGAPVLNDLAIAHRLSLALGRPLFALPDDSAFAIRRMSASVDGIDPVAPCDVAIGFECERDRRGAASGLVSSLACRSGNATRRVITEFAIVPYALAQFVRRSRKFADFAEVAIERTWSQLRQAGEDRFRFFPAERDRLSDGARVDHVPALTLVDVALLARRRAGFRTVARTLEAEFVSYADPRAPLEVFVEGKGASVEFRQAAGAVAKMKF